MTDHTTTTKTEPCTPRVVDELLHLMKSWHPTLDLHTHAEYYTHGPDGPRELVILHITEGGHREDLLTYMPPSSAPPQVVYRDANDVPTSYAALAERWDRKTLKRMGEEQAAKPSRTSYIVAPEPIRPFTEPVLSTQQKHDQVSVALLELFRAQCRLFRDSCKQLEYAMRPPPGGGLHDDRPALQRTATLTMNRARLAITGLRDTLLDRGVARPVLHDIEQRILLGQEPTTQPETGAPTTGTG